ncbi:MAG: hypothetical protein WBP41_02305 [Saprospiraceae bacterium]
MLISRAFYIENESVNLDKGSRKQPQLGRPAYEHPWTLVAKEKWIEDNTMTPILFNSIILIWFQNFGIKSDIKDHTFYTNILLNHEVYGYSSACSFDDYNYEIQTIDNSHGQWETKVTEEGTFIIRGKKLTMQPKTRLVCPKLIPEWGYKGELVYNNELRTDSFYLSDLNFCSEFSEYVYVMSDTLSLEKRDKLRFARRSYKISKTNNEVLLKCKDNCDLDYLQYPSLDYRYFRRMRN